MSSHQSSKDIGHLIQELNEVIRSLYEGLPDQKSTTVPLRRLSVTPSLVQTVSRLSCSTQGEEWQRTERCSTFSPLPGSEGQTLQALRKRFKQIVQDIRTTIHQRSHDLSSHSSPEQRAEYMKLLQKASTRSEQRQRMEDSLVEVQLGIERHLNRTGRSLGKTHASSQLSSGTSSSLVGRVKQVTDSIGLTLTPIGEEIVVSTEEHFTIELHHIEASSLPSSSSSSSSSSLAQEQEIQCVVTHFEKPLPDEVNTSVCRLLKEKRFNLLQDKLRRLHDLEKDQRNIASRFLSANTEIEKIAHPSSSLVRRLEGPGLRLLTGLRRAPISSLVMIKLETNQNGEDTLLMQLQEDTYPMPPKTLCVSASVAAELFASSFSSSPEPIASSISHGKVSRAAQADQQALLRGGSLHDLLVGFSTAEGMKVQISSSYIDEGEKLSGRKRMRPNSIHKKEEEEAVEVHGKDLSRESLEVRQGSIQGHVSIYNMHCTVHMPTSTSGTTSGIVCSALVERGYTISVVPVLPKFLLRVTDTLKRQMLFNFFYRSCFVSDSIFSGGKIRTSDKDIKNADSSHIRAEFSVTSECPSWIQIDFSSSSPSSSSLISHPLASLPPVRITIGSAPSVALLTHVSTAWVTGKDTSASLSLPCTNKYMTEICLRGQSLPVLVYFIYQAARAKNLRV